jgi:signal transduction histidine kinase
MAEQELQRVSHITRQTLSFYRESKQPISVVVPELLEDVLGLQDRALRTNHIELRKQYQPAPLVRGFPVELRQVFLNLISNAIQAMPRGGVLGVNVREATDFTTNRRGVMVSILDTGVGIRPEDARNIFQPFFSTKAAKGTGLGLWISKGIVQKYEGRITFRSLRTDKGCTTCFRVFLPVGAAAAAATGSSKSSEIANSAGGQETLFQPTIQ